MNGGEFWILFWATIGAIIVFVGLVLEKFADWLNEKFLGEYKPHKTLESVGWFLLMFGISIEIADAWWSANDAWQTKQMAIKNDPRNATISEINATAILVVKGSDFDDLTNFFAGGPAAMMTIWKDERHGTSFDALQAKDFSRNDVLFLFGDRDRREYGLKFGSLNIASKYGVEHFVQELNDVKMLRIEVTFLKHDVEIESGMVEVVLNNNVRKKFQIPIQNATNSPLSFPVNSTISGTADAAFTIIATNLSDSFEK